MMCGRWHYLLGHQQTSEYIWKASNLIFQLIFIRVLNSYTQDLCWKYCSFMRFILQILHLSLKKLTNNPHEIYNFIEEHKFSQQVLLETKKNLANLTHKVIDIHSLSIFKKLTLKLYCFNSMSQQEKINLHILHINVYLYTLVSKIWSNLLFFIKASCEMGITNKVQGHNYYTTSRREQHNLKKLPSANGSCRSGEIIICLLRVLYSSSRSAIRCGLCSANGSYYK